MNETGRMTVETTPDSTAENAEHRVTVAGVSHWYSATVEDVHALHDINLNIEHGEFVCVVGTSGCGKTTLLQLLAGFVRPTQGAIEIGGESITGPDPTRGVVFQQPTLYPWLSVRQNVSFGPRMRGLRKASYDGDVQRLLEMVGIADFADRPPYELSGGMQQRAAIARALVNDPEIVLMDEPFGALDALTRERLQEELLGIWRETRKTIFFITHSVEEAVYLGTRVIVMSPRPGRIVLDRDVRLPELRGRSASEVRSASAFSQLREEIALKIYEGDVP